MPVAIAPPARSHRPSPSYSFAKDPAFSDSPLSNPYYPEPTRYYDNPAHVPPMKNLREHPEDTLPADSVPELTTSTSSSPSSDFSIISAPGTLADAAPPPPVPAPRRPSPPKAAPAPRPVRPMRNVPPPSTDALQSGMMHSAPRSTTRSYQLRDPGVSTTHTPSQDRDRHNPLAPPSSRISETSTHPDPAYTRTAELAARWREANAGSMASSRGSSGFEVVSRPRTLLDPAQHRAAPSAHTSYRPTKPYAPPIRPAAAPPVASTSKLAPSLAGSRLKTSTTLQDVETHTQAADSQADLDRIDELDETDPLGYAWHHESPYEGINAALGKPSSAPAKKRTPNGSSIAPSQGVQSYRVSHGRDMERESIMPVPPPASEVITPVPPPASEVIMHVPPPRVERNAPPYAPSVASSGGYSTPVSFHSGYSPSVASSGGSAASSPPPSHRPKRLVMPAPLQQQQPLTVVSPPLASPPSLHSNDSAGSGASARHVPMLHDRGHNLLKKRMGVVSGAPSDLLTQGSRSSSKERAVLRRGSAQQREPSVAGEFASWLVTPNAKAGGAPEVKEVSRTSTAPSATPSGKGRRLSKRH